MAKPRKPIPKYQLTLSEGKHRAFEGFEDRGIQTNPNDANMPVNPNYQDTGIAQNRSSQMSMKDDTTKQYSIGIKDIDEAIFYYFKNQIKPFVYQNGQRREVPVIYGSMYPFNIRLRGYILPDTIQKELNATKVYNSKAKITINTETVSNIETAGKPIQNPTDDHRKRNLRDLQ